MQRSIHRSVLVASCVAALAAFSATPALAALTAVTGPVVAVTADTATLSGTVATGGVATQWEFSYNLASNPFQAGFTPGGTIPAGATTSSPVTDTATGLMPDTTYTYELVASNVTFGSTYYLLAPVYGGSLSFKTKGAGSAALGKSKLNVKKGRVTVPLKCASTLNCHGLLAITAHYKAGKKFKKAACGSTSFTILSGKRKTVTTSKVSAKCKALLTLAKKHTIKANLAVAFTTFQKPISTTVKLALG